MRARRILLVAINYWPELTGIGKYTGEMAEWLVRQGVEVRVITAPPYYPAWRVSPGYSSWRYQRERVAGVDILRCPLWVPVRPTGLKRIIHLASFALTALPIMLWSGLRWRPDFVFVVEPPLFCAPAALLAARLAGGEAWLHVQDFEVDAAFELGILRAGWLRRWVLAIERWLMRRFNRVSTISARMLERLAGKGIRADRQMLFPNWVDTSVIRPLEPPYLLRKTFNVPEEVSVLLYSGNMGRKQGLEILVQTAKLLSNRQDILFVLCGDGVAKSELEQLATSMSNIRFLPLQPPNQLNDLLNMADVHLLPQRSDTEDLVMPSKLTSMLASGRPVVATARHDTQVADVVSRCGIVTEPGNAAGLMEAIVKLVGNPAERKRMGEAGRKYAMEHWSQERILQQVFAT